MKINKTEALVLAKILHQNIGHYGLASADKSEFQETLEDLAARVDDFLTEDEEVDEECNHDCCTDEGEEDEEVEDDYEDEEEDSSEEDEEDDEESAEDEESSEEDDGDDSEDEEEELDVDFYVGGEDLHNLKAAKSDTGLVEFELVEGDDHDEKDHVDLVIDGYTEIEHVTHIKRKGKELHVRDCEDTWTVIYVDRFPKGWADALPLDSLVEVEA